MSVYFIANIIINDNEIYNKYLEKCDEVFEKFNGKYLAVDESPVVLEGKWNGDRVVMIEFPDEFSLNKWYNSNEYQDILKYRFKASVCNTLIVKGIERL